MKKFLLAFMFFVPFLMSAAIGPNVSIAPDGTELKWEEGAWDFFIMHKSLIKQVTGSASTTAGNPQADTCIEQNVGSTYTLTSKHIPTDANVDRAFLIWLAPQDPSNLNGLTDNSVTLTFTNASDPSITLTKEVTASMQGNLATTQTGTFEYEALNMPADSTSGATGVFTYRVEVSDFMKEIIAMGEAAGMKSGEALYGNYNVQGMECSNDQNYLATSGLVGGWFMPFVYTSAQISPKKIYFYHGLEAYRFQAATITVSGFELPAEAVIKLGLVVFEGDPGLASASGTALFGGGAEPEALSVSGQGNPTDFAILFNNCNPPRYQDSLGQAFNYTEIYNSISSFFGVGETFETCIGNPDNPSDLANPIEYAIDADILMVDSGPTGPFYGKFNKGDTMFNLKIGANQDQVYTNLLVVSVDTKAPKFDIPMNPKTPNGREKDYCSCSTDEDAVCSDRPFYYTIKIQNWGENQASNVTLQDTLPAQVEFVAGTTEIATKFDSNGNGTDWTAVPDVNGGFPYATAQTLANVMTQHCDKLNEPDYCSEGMWVRFVVRPKANLSKNEVIRNTAVITGDSMPYNSNSNIPLRLTLGKCPPVTDCELPPKMQCGGVKIDNENYCASDSDCKGGKKCKNNECVLDASGDLASGVNVSYDKGANTPTSESEILVTSPSESLVLAQFYLLSEDGESNKYYKFNTAEFKFTKDADVEEKNFKLYKDNNGDGKVDEGDTLIATVDTPKSGLVDFSIINEADRLNKTGIKNNYIVTADVQRAADSGNAGKFNLTIESESAFNVEDANGRVSVKGDKIDFVSFRFEPTEGFIFTKGLVSPSIPSYKDFNGEHEMLQVRTKSIAKTNAIKSLRVKTPSNTSYAKFGDGIKSITIIEDKNGDGIENGNDVVVKKVTEFANPSTVSIDGLKDFLQYAENEEKYLIFKVEFKMQDGQKAKISVDKVSLNDGDAVGTPVSSSDFIYQCDPSDPNSCGSGDDDGGCALTALPENDNSMLYVAVLAMVALAFGAFRFFSVKK